MRTRANIATVLVAAACAYGAGAPPAQAFNPLKPICSATGLFSGLAGKACTVVQNGGRLVNAGKNLLDGHLGGAVKSALGQSGGAVASTATTALALAAIGSWVFGGAKYALHETSAVLAHTTSPQLTSTWFSASYWRVAGIGAVLTLPFLFAAAVQALIQSDVTLLARAALGYLPLAMLAVVVAAPLTMLLLAASDQMAAIVSSAAGHESAHFLDRVGAIVGGVTLVARSPFLVFFVGVLMVAGAVCLWIELVMREAAVYVIVLMLPLVFAAMVWPARRVWAVRAVELLIALILSKFAIVAVLSLGGAALSHSFFHDITGMVAGVVLLAMGAFAPWALLRLLPISELASSAAGSLRREAQPAAAGFQRAAAWGDEGHDWASTAAEMRRDADQAERADAAALERERLEALAVRVPATSMNGDQAEPRSNGTQRGSAADGAGASEPVAASDGAAPAPPAAAGADDSEVSAERIPGLPAMWQAENGQWRTLTLGPEDSGVWPPEDSGAPPPTDPGPLPEDDRRPDPQPPEDGGL